MTPIVFTVYMEPHGKGAPKAVRRGKRAGVTKDPVTARWESAFTAASRAYAPPTPLTGPIQFSMLSVKSRPKGLRGFNGLVWCPKKPDRSNVAKSVEDAMTKAGFWEDDNQLVYGVDLTAYAEVAGRPRIVVRVSRPDSSPFAVAMALGLY